MSDLFFEKEEWFLKTAKQKFDFDFKIVYAPDFYRDVFPFGSFEERMGFLVDYPKTNKGNGFLVYTTSEEKKRTRMVFDDHSEIWEHTRNDCAFMSPISYFGKNRTLANARELFALVFDLDEVGAKELELLFTWYFYAYDKPFPGGNYQRLPTPTYVVNSGNGVHLYYLFENPIPLYPNIQRQLKKLKYALTEKLWNRDTSRLKQRQFQGINQGFRLVGSGSKRGYTILAHKTGEKVTLDYLSRFVAPENRITDTFYHSKLTLEEAKKKYPDWYHQRIELGREKKEWTCKRALYDWWKRQVTGIVYHHRYFFIMCLTVYAVKCGIDFDELKKDAYSFQNYLNDKNPDEPFTDYDIESALEMYQECYRSFPRDEISKLSGIEIKANKRNGRKQKQHLEGARAIQAIKDKYDDTNWRDGNGRKSYRDAVFTFLECHSKSTVKEFCELTGMSRAVFFKYKKQFLNKKKPRTHNPGDTISPQQ